MSTLKQWQKIGPGWWWFHHSEADHEGAIPGYHVDLTLTIWPAWRFSVCRWDGFRPRHNYVRGWRFGRRRAMRAAEAVLRWLVVLRSQETPPHDTENRPVFPGNAVAAPLRPPTGVSSQDQESTPP